MQLATIEIGGAEQPGVRTSGGVVPLARINSRYGKKWPLDMLALIRSGALDTLHEWYTAGGREELEDSDDPPIPLDQAKFAPLYRHPGKIWGIGLNYTAHAADLSEKAPTGIPASFMKPDTTIIGHGGTIRIPVQSQRTTAEAELGLIIKKRCKNVEKTDWLDVVAGFTAVIDMTAEDILRQNPRYLTLSKSFDTFFSFGPFLVTPDDIPDISNLKVATRINGRTHAENSVANMTFPPDMLVTFHSSVMTLLAGDIISTGTPGAVQIANDDRVSCHIDGFAPLVNPVADLKGL